MYRENVKTEVMAWPLVPPERQSRKREPSVVQKKRKRANDLQTEYMACCSRKASTTERSSLPGSVSPSRRLPRRTKASIPSSSSRSLMCLATPGCEENRVLATDDAQLLEVHIEYSGASAAFVSAAGKTRTRCGFRRTLSPSFTPSWRR